MNDLSVAVSVPNAPLPPAGTPLPVLGAEMTPVPRVGAAVGAGAVVGAGVGASVIGAIAEKPVIFQIAPSIRPGIVRPPFAT